MRYEISASQLSEIAKNGVVWFTNVITESELAILKHHAGTRDSFQICPLTKKILTSRSLGSLLFEIIEKRPIRLVMSKKMHPNESLDFDHISIDTIYLGIFFPFDGDASLFFNKNFVPEFETEGLVVLYGDARARYVRKDQDPEVSYLLKKGYASGDKLSDKEYPLVFK